MATIIKQCEVVERNGNSAIDNAVLAGMRCIENANVTSDKIGVLINTGVFRDKNIMEPSIASIIQKKIQLGLDFNPKSPDSICFSFDLLNGACGFLNAVKVADSILRNRTTDYVLIVAGDSHPSTEDHPDFPYVSIGSAVILTHEAETDQGFQDISYLSSDYNQESTHMVYGDLATFGDQGRNQVTIQSSDEHAQSSHDLSVKHINSYLDKNNIQSIDFFVSNDPEPGFSRKVCESSALPDSTRVLDLNSIFQGDVHTASTIAGFHHLYRELKHHNNQTILFSLVGSGNASSCALYRL